MTARPHDAEADTPRTGAPQAGAAQADAAETDAAVADAAVADMAEGVRAEVVRHHQVIEGWLAGTVSRASFGRFADAHAPGFTLAAPDGRLLSRAEVLAEVEAAYGRVPDARIEIRDVTVVTATPTLVVARYEEWQHAAGRRATVVLERGPAGPRWLHLHETWLAG
ncbi:DUF4440 domain-containing protein [Nonomuraea indica]|uniref:DUF4440 domain-containing protein n=1 Tax=Nonomuraea indica TaxID=1581193 RepID=A0ABW8A7A1_9ACTN